MPMYEYRCTKGHTFEVSQPINDDALTKCQVCGSPVARVLHSPAVHFKGSGFYNTDYGTRNRQREQKSHNEAKASDSGSSESSSSSSEEKKSTTGDKAKPASDKAKPASS
jgi:putative FmdB family regulatory protein